MTQKWQYKVKEEIKIGIEIINTSCFADGNNNRVTNITLGAENLK